MSNTKKNNNRIGKIGKIILLTIAAAGVISMAIVAPNALQMLDMFSGKNKKKLYRKYYINNSISRLKKQNLIEFKKVNNKTFLRLTKKGQNEVLKYKFQEKIIEKPKKWDKKWRVIIFDIKEHRRTVRNKLRNTLIDLGFIKLQNSVWIFPYECEEVIIMLKSHFFLGKDVLYMTVDKIENDKWLKKEFGLKK